MEQLGVDLKQLIAQAINFALFFLIFKKYIATPFARFFAEQLGKEKEKEEILVKIKKDEEVSTEKQLKMKEETKREMQKTLQEARSEAENIKNELTAQANKEAEEIRSRAQKQSEEEREKLNRAAKERMVDLSIAIVEGAFKDFLDEETRKKITQHILNNFGKKHVYYEN